MKFKKIKNSIPDIDNWCLITTYKDNFDFMESFVKYYNQEWGIKKFYFIIGITKKSFPEKIIKRIQKLNRGPLLNIEYILFNTNEIVSESLWGKQKKKYFSILNKSIPDKYYKFLNIDNDEFYYVKNKNILKDREELHFHFVEFVPREIFDLMHDFRWSLQGWFYRVNSFKDKENVVVKKQIRLNELLKIKRDMTEKNGATPLNNITHQWCKVINFKRKNIMNCLRHEDGGNLCMKIKKIKKTSNILNLLKANYFCYHLAILDKDYFINKKPKWLNPRTNKIKHQAGDINTNIEDYFKMYYTHTNVYTFKDNFLKKFWDN